MYQFVFWHESDLFMSRSASRMSLGRAMEGESLDHPWSNPLFASNVCLSASSISPFVFPRTCYTCSVSQRHPARSSSPQRMCRTSASRTWCCLFLVTRWSTHTMKVSGASLVRELFSVEQVKELGLLGYFPGVY